jgi:hypothetical protein
MRSLSLPQHASQPWGLSCLLYMGYHGMFPQKYNRGVKLTIHLHLVPRLRILEIHFHSPYIFMAWCLIKPRDKFTFTVTEFTHYKLKALRNDSLIQIQA